MCGLGASGLYAEYRWSSLHRLSGSGSGGVTKTLQSLKGRGEGFEGGAAPGGMVMWG